MLCPDSSVDSVWHPEGLFISLDAKEGFICIVFQWLALAGEAACSWFTPCNGYGLQWKRLWGGRKINGQKEGIRGPVERKFIYRKNTEKWKMAILQNPRRQWRLLLVTCVLKLLAEGEVGKLQKKYSLVFAEGRLRKGTTRVLGWGGFLFGYFYNPQIIKAEGRVIYGWSQNRYTELFIGDCNHASKIEYESLGWQT